MTQSEKVAQRGIQLREVGVVYERAVALSDVSLDVALGEWVGVIGANGAGKSTLLRAMARLVKYRGTIRIDGHETGPMHRRDFARLVAYVPQSPQFPAQMRAIDYVTLGRTPHHRYLGGESSHDRDRSAELLGRLDMSHLALRHLDSMSGGELQRLVLARALAQSAPILLLDEPTSALDVGRRVEVLELVDELRLERNLTVISTVHDLTLAAQFVERLVLLSNGAVVVDGTPEAVLVEEVVNRHFDVRVEILRSEHNGIVVTPRRAKSKGSHD